MAFRRIQYQPCVPPIFLWAILLLPIWQVCAQVLPEGLVASYSFDEGTGTIAADSSGNGNAGVIQGATWVASGRYRPALFFDGASGHVNLGDPGLLQMTGSMTLSAWVYATAHPSDDGQILARSTDTSGWQLKTTLDTGFRTFGIGISPDGATLTQQFSRTIIELNTWYHVAGVYNAGAQTLDVYVNGVVDNGTLSGAVPVSQSAPNVNATVGMRSGGYYFTVSANRRYLVDRNNQPFLMLGDSPQSLIVNLSNEDAGFYFANRKAAGFNTVWINLLCTDGTGGNADGNTYDGIAPFTTRGDLSTPNETYFARAGYGTYASDGSVNDSDYVTAAATADGTLAIAYLPTSRTVTVEMSKFAGTVTAQWCDPAAAAILRDRIRRSTIAEPVSSRPRG